MKKLIFLLLIGLIPILLSAQYQQRTGSFAVPAGDDTTVYIPMGTPANVEIEFNYKALDDTDGILDLASIAHKDSTTFDRVDDSRIPYTLADSTVTFRFVDGFPSRLLGVKMTKESNTAGLLIYWTLTIIR